MSTSPDGHYDPNRSSRAATPPTPAEVRSQAIAKLKRAASLPRNKDGRRPSQDEHVDTPLLKDVVTAPPAEGDHEEILSGSPTDQEFDHAHHGMQRSGSQSSDFHLPTPPFLQNSGGLSPASAASPSDWSAMQLAQSYLPSLSPAGYSPSPFGSRQHSARNTPSPLPSLGDLRTLSRSNSQMARARAMDKLTGGRDTSPIPPPMAQDDMTIKPSQAGRLHRAGTVGARTFNTTPIVPALPVEEPATELARPRLQRSFTVSSTNMGEERRSAVGRRMMERLAGRPAAREQEAEVRKLWEERRAERVEDPESEPESDDVVPTVQRHSPGEPAVEHFQPGVTFGDTQTLGIPDRPVSRETMQSNGGPFEYEYHLRRSLSSRTARNAVGTVSDSEPETLPAPQGSDVEHLERYYHPSPIIEQEVYDLAPPRPAFATPSRHVAQDSTSTDGTIQGDKSPGSDTSRDGLNSMMFVMGHGGHGGPASTRQEGSYPTEVGDQGSSDWGTPQRSMDWSSPKQDDVGSLNASDSHRVRDHMPRSTLSSAVVSEVESSALSHEMRESGMSWTEVGGPADLEVPSDVRYHKKSGSVSAKFGRTVKTAMRNRSQSRSSVDSNSPNVVGEVFNQVKATFSRRGSTTSSTTSPRVNSTAQMSHQPSMSSLSPSLARSDSISNSALLQHEGPNREWMPRRADPDDPRIVSSKMSPFPGIAALEDKSRLLEPPVAPRLIQQASDSIVPTQQRTQAIEPIYALPLPIKGDGSRQESTESSKKQGWLAKTFSTPRSSGSMSLKSSAHDTSPVPDSQISPSLASDPFAPLPLPAPIAMRRTGSRTGRASPSVSVVPEGSEDGSRITRFATPVNRLDQSSTPIKEDSGLKETPADLLHRFESILALGPDDRPEILDDPPRKSLISSSVIQVVNTHAAKDRYLFMFNDILVITKVLVTDGWQGTLDMQHIVKSIVPLEQVEISGFEAESPDDPERTAVMETFVDRFAADPVGACRYLADKSGPKIDAGTLASVLFQTPALDKTQLGNLLCGNDSLVRAYVDRFNFAGIGIDDALRMFLLSLRMPSDPNASGNLLFAFAERYHAVNEESIAYDSQLATDLVLAIVQFNDALYGTFGFAAPNHAITQDAFVSAFRSRDRDQRVPDQLLADIYLSIRSDPLVQALATHERGLAKEVGVSPAKLSTKLTYNMNSCKIYVSIPAPDPSFKIRLQGEGLVFEPPILDFSGTSEMSFRVKSTGLGTKTLLFDRLGPNAARYAGLGNGRSFTVERGFKRYCSYISFMSSTHQKRKYCFSVDNEMIKTKWGNALAKQIAVCKAKAESSDTNRNQLRQTADKVSLQVLKDTLIPPEDHASKPPPRPRQGSTSMAYERGRGNDEMALGPLIPPLNVGPERAIGQVRTGKEVVLLCRQNSLLPGLLELLSAEQEDVESQKQLSSSRHRTIGSSGLSQSQDQSFGHGRTAGGGSMSEAKRGIMTGRF